MALSIAELAPQDEKLQLLLEAIDSASRGTLQVVLKAMCQDDQCIRDRVSNSLLITEYQVRILSKYDDESDEEGSEDEEDEEDEQSEDENPRPKEKISNQATSGSKRLRQRYAYCENCKNEFDVTQNTSTSCRYHTGQSALPFLFDKCYLCFGASSVLLKAKCFATEYCYPDGDFFVDDDYYDNGEYDKGEMLEEYPEGYIYECCDRRANEEPCTVSRHRESVSTKRPRI